MNTPIPSGSYKRLPAKYYKPNKRVSVLTSSPNSRPNRRVPSPPTSKTPARPSGSAPRPRPRSRPVMPRGYLFPSPSLYPDLDLQLPWGYLFPSPSLYPDLDLQLP